MSEPKEITIKIKCEDELVIKQKFLVYEDVYVSSMDEVIRDCIEQAKGSYKGGIDGIKVTINLEVI
jgi:hypothetical protein